MRAVCVGFTRGPQCKRAHFRASAREYHGGMSRNPTIVELQSRLQAWVKETGRRAGLDISRSLPDRELRRARILESVDADLVLDVGANVGEYGQRLRASGYRGAITSFEPQEASFKRLQATAARDGAWSCRRLALGDRDGEATLNVSANSYSSSLREIEPDHQRVAPGAARVRQERVPLARLETVWADVAAGALRPFLKIDVQGFESEVLNGAARCLEQIHGIELELSLVPLYRGQTLAREIIDLLDDSGFSLVGVEPVLIDEESGRTLQADGLFVRTGP